MFTRFVIPQWKPLRDEDVIHGNDFIEDIPTGQRIIVGRSMFYKFLVGQRAGQARYIPYIHDIVRAT